MHDGAMSSAIALFMESLLSMSRRACVSQSYTGYPMALTMRLTTLLPLPMPPVIAINRSMDLLGILDYVFHAFGIDRYVVVYAR